MSEPRYRGESWQASILRADLEAAAARRAEAERTEAERADREAEREAERATRDPLQFGTRPHPQRDRPDQSPVIQTVVSPGTVSPSSGVLDSTTR
ncbi:hypothetical protein G3N18_09370 [Microbacterium sp. 2C]|nr:hypothetical protein [Microbacterium paulum]